MIEELEGLDYTNGQTGSSSVNNNGMETGSLSTNTNGDGDSNNTEATQDQITVTRLQISEAVKKIPNLIYISYDYAFEIKSVYDIPKCHEIGLVKDHTGLTTSQWSSIINTLNVDKLNRRIDAYVNA